MSEKESESEKEASKTTLLEEIDVPLDEATSEDITAVTFGVEELQEAIKKHNRAEIIRFFEEIPDADIAEAAEELDIKELISLFRSIPSETSAPLFDEFSQEKKEELIAAMTDKELVALINEQYADDLADTVDEMPANLAKRVLQAASKDMREDINRLLKYQDDTAGAIMTTEYLEFKDDTSIKEAIRQIRAKGKNAETVYTIFVMDKERRFVGTVALDDLIFAKEDDKLSEIMEKGAPYCHVNTDKEEVAYLFRKYRINALAVLNTDERLTGIVTMDDAVDVMTEETTEDIEAMNAVSTLDDAYLETHPWQMMRKCLPWIVVLLVLGTFSSLVLSRFQNMIAVYSVLAAFIPTIMDTGGNAGGQTIALVIRGLALKEFETKDFWKLLRREALSSLLIAAGVAVFAFFWFTLEQYTGIVHNPSVDYIDGTQATIWNGLAFSATEVSFDGISVSEMSGGTAFAMIFLEQSLKISGVVALTMFVTIIVSKLIAVSLPLLVAKLKKDPAIVSQPMLTTIVDVVCLLIFFAIAYLLVLAPLGLA